MDDADAWAAQQDIERQRFEACPCGKRALELCDCRFEDEDDTFDHFEPVEDLSE